MANGSAKLAWIRQMIQEGRTVYIATAYCATAITPKVAARWAAGDRPLLKVSHDNHLLLASGRKYVSAEYCRLVAR